MAKLPMQRLLMVLLRVCRALKWRLVHLLLLLRRESLLLPLLLRSLVLPRRKPCSRWL